MARGVGAIGASPSEKSRGEREIHIRLCTDWRQAVAPSRSLYLLRYYRRQSPFGEILVYPSGGRLRPASEAVMAAKKTYRPCPQRALNSEEPRGEREVGFTLGPRLITLTE